MNKKTKKIIMIVVLVLLVLGTGYASLKLNISIDGTTTIKNNNFVIKLENIVTKEGSVTPTKAATIGDDNTSISFDAVLENPGDYYEFNVDLVNSGTLNAEIENVFISELTEIQQNYLIYEIKYSDGTLVSVGDRLFIGEHKTITVLLKYKDNPTSYPSTSEETLSLSFDIDWVEASIVDVNLRNSLNSHVQMLPYGITKDTNLYTTLVPENGYYSASEWLENADGYDDTQVVSVTIPVLPGDKLLSNAFDSDNPKAASKGIRVTYLMDETIVKSLDPTEVYNEYINNGYLTVPEGVNTANIPWWFAADDNWLNLIID